MSTIKRYAFWNNKGGVGKTFLCFASACEYAKTHPTTQVVVIDACPQANISEIILGGNSTGDDKLTGLLDKTIPQTIGGYYQQRVYKPFEKTGTESDFLLRARDYNANMPDNLYLIAGDPSLELQVEAINLHSMHNAVPGAWRLVHLWVKDLQDAAVVRFGEDCTFFVDCNPSFSAYTKQVMLAADRLITPCTADGSSARAIDNVFKLIYGLGVPPQYIKASFKSLADIESLSLPMVYLVPMNRSTIHGNRPASAFRAMFDKIKRTVDKVQKIDSQYFYKHKGGRDVFIDIPDAHTVAVVSSYTGTPISDIKVGPCNFGEDEKTQVKTQVNAEPLDRYCNAVKDFVALL